MTLLSAAVVAWVLVVPPQGTTSRTVSDIASEKACHDLAHRMGYTRDVDGQWWSQDHLCLSYEKAQESNNVPHR